MLRKIEATQQALLKVVPSLCNFFRPRPADSWASRKRFSKYTPTPKLSCGMSAQTTGPLALPGPCSPTSEPSEAGIDHSIARCDPKHRALDRGPHPVNSTGRLPVPFRLGTAPIRPRLIVFYVRCVVPICDHIFHCSTLRRTRFRRDREALGWGGDSIRFLKAPKSLSSMAWMRARPSLNGGHERY